MHYLQLWRDLTSVLAELVSGEKRCRKRAVSLAVWSSFISVSLQCREPWLHANMRKVTSADVPVKHTFLLQHQSQPSLCLEQLDLILIASNWSWHCSNWEPLGTIGEEIPTLSSQAPDDGSNKEAIASISWVVWLEFSGWSLSAIKCLDFPVPLEDSSPVWGKGKSQTVCSVTIISVLNAKSTFVVHRSLQIPPSL